MVERAVSMDAAAVVRFRGTDQRLSCFVRLPYDVLAGRTVAAAGSPFDVTVSAIDLLKWLDESGPEPPRRDAHWLSALPPATGWERVEVVPDSAIRDVIRSGAVLARTTETKRGQESLLSSIVLTATSATRSVDVPLGPLSALTRMGFLPRNSRAAVDVARGWIRIAAPFGSTFAGTGAGPLSMLDL
jgi:hypothetical protein